MEASIGDRVSDKWVACMGWNVWFCVCWYTIYCNMWGHKDPETMNIFYSMVRIGCILSYKLSHLSPFCVRNTSFIGVRWIVSHHWNACHRLNKGEFRAERYFYAVCQSPCTLSGSVAKSCPSTIIIFHPLIIPNPPEIFTDSSEIIAKYNTIKDIPKINFEDEYEITCCVMLFSP